MLRSHVHRPAKSALLIAAAAVLTSNAAAAMPLPFVALEPPVTTLAVASDKAELIHSIVASAGAPGRRDEDRLDEVNRFFNSRIQYATDLEVWGVEDYWATPLEALSKGRGDCEDYVIAKYFTLVDAGVPVEKLRLVYATVTLGSLTEGITASHMVLAYLESPTADALILDNLLASVMPASRRPDLLLLRSFNEVGVWEGLRGRYLGRADQRIEMWRDVLAKMRFEGFPRYMPSEIALSARLPYSP